MPNGQGAQRTGVTGRPSMRRSSAPLSRCSRFRSGHSVARRPSADRTARTARTGAAASHRRRFGALRRRTRARRRDLPGQCRRDLRAHRPERRRQDDAVQLHHPALPGRGRLDLVRRPADQHRSGATGHLARHRPDLPESRHLCRHDGARERPPRRASFARRTLFSDGRTSLPRAISSRP